MHELLSWIEASALGRFMRESSLWTYPIVNLLHVLGIGALFGSTLILDLRLLGAWRRTALSAIADTAVPVAASGLSIAAATGIALFATKATEYYGNPFLPIKFAAIAIGLANIAIVRRTAVWRRRGGELSAGDTRRLAVAGGVSLACWLTAIAAGRFIAYW